MNKVWRVDVKVKRIVVASALFSNEKSAQSYADQYRESELLYHVSVMQVDVYD